MKTALVLPLLLLFAAPALAAEEAEWITMFDGKSLAGWKANENAETWSVKEGAIACKGQRSHLFYVGQEEPFVNFEFEAKVLTKPGANAGIYFHTQYQDSGWPKYGYEAQVNATQGDPKKTGSLYAVENVDKANHEDNEWFTYNIKVDGRRIVLTVNGEVQVDYTEPEGKEAGADFTRVLDKRTFALQGHDPGSEVWFKDLKVRRLP